MSELTITLNPETERLLQEHADRQGLALREYVENVVEGLARAPESISSPPKPIWQVAADLLADLPPEDLARLPVDGAEQHDHYIYGTPKRFP